MYRVASSREPTTPPNFGNPGLIADIASQVEERAGCPLGEVYLCRLQAALELRSGDGPGADPPADSTRQVVTIGGMTL